MSNVFINKEELRYILEALETSEDKMMYISRKALSRLRELLRMHIENDQTDDLLKTVRIK